MYESVYVFLHLLCTCVCVRARVYVRVCTLNQNDAFVLWIVVLWDMTPCNPLLYLEAGGGSFLRNIRTYPHNYTASHSISQQSARALSLLIFELVLCPVSVFFSRRCRCLPTPTVSFTQHILECQYLCQLFGQIGYIVGLFTALCSLPAATKQKLNSNRPDTNDCMTPQIRLQSV